MKTRDSGMPEESWWESFFRPEQVLDALGLDQVDGPLIDVGCGYGTFTIPAARRSPYAVHALDIDPQMVERTAARAHNAGLRNVQARVADAVGSSLGVPDASVAVVLVFNLLHCEEPGVLLSAARRALRPGGRLAAIHWRSDVSTPRGPDLSIRPRPETLRDLVVDSGFQIVIGPVVLPPYHVGVVGRAAS
jgi:SAM-dependent methyltransferase